MGNKKLQPVQCRICKQKIDRNIELEGVDWVMPSRNYFYHKKCYRDWKNSSPQSDEEWVSFIYDFLSRDLKVTYDFHMCEAQRKKYLRENKMTNKGIFFSLKYFYEIKNGNWEKSHGGLGIIPFIYNEACSYWVIQEKKSQGICKKIEKQMRQLKERDTRVVYKKKEKSKQTIDLSVIEGMEDE